MPRVSLLKPLILWAYWGEDTGHVPQVCWTQIQEINWFIRITSWFLGSPIFRYFHILLVSLPSQFLSKTSGECSQTFYSPPYSSWFLQGKEGMITWTVCWTSANGCCFLPSCWCGGHCAPVGSARYVAHWRYWSKLMSPNHLTHHMFERKHINSLHERMIVRVRSHCLQVLCGIASMIRETFPIWSEEVSPRIQHSTKRMIISIGSNELSGFSGEDDSGWWFHDLMVISSSITEEAVWIMGLNSWWLVGFDAGLHRTMLIFGLPPEKCEQIMKRTQLQSGNSHPPESLFETSSDISYLYIQFLQTFVSVGGARYPDKNPRTWNGSIYGHWFTN